MFERYTERARRVIFFGRYEASQFGTPVIEPEHLLLALLREEKNLIGTLLGNKPLVSPEFIRKQIESQIPKAKKISTSVDLPLAPATQRVLANAHEESDRLNHKHIGTEHIVLGLLREEQSFSASLLVEAGLSLESVRQRIRKLQVEIPWN